MTAKQIYENAIALLGYTDSAAFQRKALPAINKTYYELFQIFSNNDTDFEAIESLNDEVVLPQKAFVSALPLGVASMIALGEGDGELQQYFASEYDRAVKRFNRKEQIITSY